MVRIEDAFGYDIRVPEKIRETFMWLCNDVADLQSKWDFYLELYGKEENTALLSELAPWSFNIIEESLRNDMTMAICRLSDRSITMGEKNLSLATLVENCPDISGLDTTLAEFQASCKPISKWRNKHVGHKDFKTLIRPREKPLPGINKIQIEQILILAEKILKIVCLYYTKGELGFYTISRGGAEDLIFWLKAGQEHHSRD
jgi:hypothetical protein